MLLYQPLVAMDAQHVDSVCLLLVRQLSVFRQTLHQFLQLIPNRQINGCYSLGIFSLSTGKVTGVVHNYTLHQSVYLTVINDLCSLF